MFRVTKCSLHLGHCQSGLSLGVIGAAFHMDKLGRSQYAETESKVQRRPALEIQFFGMTFFENDTNPLKVRQRLDFSVARASIFCEVASLVSA